MGEAPTPYPHHTLPERLLRYVTYYVTLRHYVTLRLGFAHITSARVAVGPPPGPPKDRTKLGRSTYWFFSMCGAIGCLALVMASARSLHLQQRECRLERRRAGQWQVVGTLGRAEHGPKEGEHDVQSSLQMCTPGPPGLRSNGILMSSATAAVAVSHSPLCTCK